jgi:hypothetical protein
MADDKEPMQASGDGDAAVDEGNPPSSGRPDMADNAGQSEGGAYPNPHTGKDEGGFRGGQSDAAYFGKGQLGEDKLGKTDNAPAEEE